jgi:hypothetical protein
MSMFGCCLWWFLFGALLGWLANWMLGRIVFSGGAITTVYSYGGGSAAAGGVDVTAARAAGFMVSGPDNLEVIEGVGPKIAHLLRANGVNSFSKLAGMNIDAIRAVLQRGGPQFNLAEPRSWAEQANLAAANRWQDLRELQDRIFDGHKT